MATPIVGPLQKPDLEKINEQLAALNRTQLDIEKAQAAGIECAEHDTLCQNLKAKLEAIRQTYFGPKA